MSGDAGVGAAEAGAAAPSGAAEDDVEAGSDTAGTGNAAIPSIPFRRAMAALRSHSAPL
ncbi:MAG: hypothetical protein J0H19_04535 [Rhodospirillales bacterium]|nr:hypothetical protein [Rhodospirillales bacterium]MBN8925872.1 hypothetical protein [Rhodospirillales bacterium]